MGGRCIGQGSWIISTKSWNVGDDKIFEDLQKESENVWQTDIDEWNENDFFESMLGMTHRNDLLEHHLEIDNSHPDDEFDDDNVFVWNV